MSNSLQFGTAGIRATMGPGKDQINNHTIQLLTEGLSQYLLSSFAKESKQQGIVICYDSRLHSKEFAQEAASVLTSHTIPVYLMRDLRPTPFLSFAIRYLRAIGGINITASHNPKEYNGYKIYWADGGQVVAPHEQKISKKIQEILKKPLPIYLPYDSNKEHFVSEAVEKAFLCKIQEHMTMPSLNHNQGNKLFIIYSPLNGTGITLIPKALNQCGFTYVECVEEQKKPDGNFPTTPYPNPETPEAMTLGIRDLLVKQGDILLISDPDADRLACSCLHQQIPYNFTGNELGIILLAHLLRTQHPISPWATITTTVSSPLIKKITEKAGGTCFEVPVGFKNIAQKILEWEKGHNTHHFFFGIEESLGFLYGDFVRDKDSVTASCLTSEAALFCKKENKTLVDFLIEIFAQFGIYQSGQLSISASHSQFFCIQLQKMRRTPPRHLKNLSIISIEDYQSGIGYSFSSQERWALSYSQLNVLSLLGEDGSKWILRPSGTEPKMKLYGHMRANPTSFSSIQEGIAFLKSTIYDHLLYLKNLLEK